MRIKTHSRRKSLRTVVTVFGAMAIAFAVSASSANAQSSVQFEIGESALMLEASLALQDGIINQTQFDQLQMAESCKNPAERLQDRNRPWMSVLNTSTDPDEITSVTVDLKEAGFEFGNGDVANDGFAGFLSVLSNRSDAGVSLDSAAYGADNTELVLNFSGLTNGQAAIFQIDIDEPGGSMMFPDFREAMLGADTGSGPGDLAMMTTEFGSGQSAMSTFARSAPLSTSGITEGYHTQTMTMIETSTEVPEPTTLALFGLGLCSLTATRRRR